MRRYSSGSWIPVIVDITTNHGGYFIFKLCHNDDTSRDPGQECFDQHVLQVRTHYTRKLSTKGLLLAESANNFTI